MEARYIVDENGKRVSIILDIKEYERMVEKLEDIHIWRIRVGDYQIVYGIDEEQRIVKVLNVAHRRDVYR